MCWCPCVTPILISPTVITAVSGHLPGSSKFPCVMVTSPHRERRYSWTDAWHKFPVTTMRWILPGTRSCLNLGGRSKALWGIFRSPIQRTRTMASGLGFREMLVRGRKWESFYDAIAGNGERKSTKLMFMKKSGSLKEP